MPSGMSDDARSGGGNDLRVTRNEELTDSLSRFVVATFARRAALRRHEGRVGKLAILEAEVDLALVEHELLSFRRSEVDAVRVDVLHRVTDPHVPSLFGDLFVDPLAEIVLVGRLRETRQFLAELLAHHHAGRVAHDDHPFSRSRRWPLVRDFLAKTGP